MTLTGSNIISEAIHHREIERRGCINAIKMTEKADVSEWYVEDLTIRKSKLTDEISDLKKDLKRLQGA